VAIRKLETTTAFIASDFNDARPSVGIVRCAPKILQGGAKEMARSLTYRYASFGMQVGGASAGINADPADRADAIAAFVAEVLPLTESSEFYIDASTSVKADDLGTLFAADNRADVLRESVDGVMMADQLTADGAVAAARAAHGPLDGATALIDGFANNGPAIARTLAAEGVLIIGVGTTKGSAHSPFGLDADALDAAWQEHGNEMASHLGVEAQGRTDLFVHAADLLFSGSKMGAIDHKVAADIAAKVIVPTGPLPYTTKAVINLDRAGVIVLPDFVTTAGPIFGEWPTGEATVDAVRASASDAIGALTTQVLADAKSRDVPPILAACERAEEFLLTWRDELPFGRPFAP